MIRAVAGTAAAVAFSVFVVAQAPTPPDSARLRREDAYRQNNIGVAGLEQYDYAGAADAFRRALETQPTLTIARLNLAIAFLYDGRLDEAGREAAAAAEGLRTLPHPHFVTGLIARADNRPDEAAAAFERVIAIDAADVGARVQLGQVRLAQRRFTDAAALFERALQLEPFNATAAYGLAQALTRGGGMQRGEEAMRRFQALRDNPAAITYSSTYLEQGRYGEAIASTGLEADLVSTAVPTIAFVDATASALPARLPVARDVSFSDVDTDGDADLLLAAGDGVRLLRNAKGRFEAGPVMPAKGARGVVAGDYDNDGAKDVLVLTDATVALFHQEPAGTFRDVTATMLPAALPPSRTAAFVDADHDGDVDIVAGSRLLRNNGNGRFTDVTKEARLDMASRTPIAVVPTDYDNRRDVDLLFLSDAAAPALFSNQRDGTFRDVAGDVGLPPASAYTAVAVADINKDLAPDFFLARSNAAGVFALSGQGSRFTLADAPAETANATAALFVDYDNDGLPDLFAWTPAGPRLWRSAGTRWIDVSSPALPGPLVPDRERAAAMSAADIDGDGDEDLVVRLVSGLVRVWSNEGGSRNNSLRVRLVSRVSNRDAAGAKVDVRAGGLRHRIETFATTPAVAPADVLFGLGSRETADVVRVLWPAGIVQAETAPAAKLARAITVNELDRKPSSCPFLYTWNGARFEFVTDFLGGGEMGYWVSPGVRNVPDPDEYVRIRGDQLRERGGRYEVRVTNELEEALFLDRVQLVAIAHRRGVDIYANEGLRSPDRREPHRVYTVRGPRPPRTAVDEHGHDVLARIAERDRRYVDDFGLSRIQGYAEEHALTIDTAADASERRVLLLLTGWTDYAFSSDNVAAHQAGLPFRPPELQVKDASGAWRTVLAEIGLPVGRPQTVVVDVTPHTRRGLREFRIVTTLRVYWDEILVDRSEVETISVATLDPAAVTLRWRGFSAEHSGDGRLPFTYDYDRVSADAPWKVMAGLYTREGDVLPLVSATDDRFVVAASGDEIAIAFEASALPALPDGWTRTFLLFADGFTKEMNLRSSSPDTVEPLPFHGMRAYPYLAPERYPSTPAHERYRAEYNTRMLRRLPSGGAVKGTR